MGIHFTEQDWARVRQAHGQWWEGRLERSLVKVTVPNAHPATRPCPSAPVLSQSNCNDFSWSPEALVDALDWQLSQEAYLGDAFPYVNFHTFGPGVAAAFCGAKLDNSSGRVWFFPEKTLPIEEIRIVYDPDNPWTRRIKDIYRAGHALWQGQVLMSMPDLGGVLDIVATFVGTQELLFALYDAPEEVQRLVREASAAWRAAYDDLCGTLFPMNPGYSDWSGLYSATPSYILQCDFAYMIRPEMFRDFALEELHSACKNLSHAIYHLDGVGQLHHLDMLLKIPELHAVQWVYGAGQPTAAHWPEVYEAILASGKGAELLGSNEEMEHYAKKYPKGLYYRCSMETVREAEAFLKRLGI